jgi:hypothetical protein
MATSHDHVHLATFIWPRLRPRRRQFRSTDAPTELCPCPSRIFNPAMRMRPIMTNLLWLVVKTTAKGPVQFQCGRIELCRRLRSAHWARCQGLARVPAFSIFACGRSAFAKSRPIAFPSLSARQSWLKPHAGVVAPRHDAEAVMLDFVKSVCLQQASALRPGYRSIEPRGRLRPHAGPRPPSDSGCQNPGRSKKRSTKLRKPPPRVRAAIEALVTGQTRTITAAA